MRHHRQPRFKRSTNIAPMCLTERDRAIIRCFRRYRFLRSSHFASLLPGSAQQLLRRLQLLYHHGYLERPRCQIDYFISGSKRIVYGLGKKGGSLLNQESPLAFHRFDFHKRSKPGRFFLEHTLMVSDFMVAMEKACQAQTSIRLIMPDELVGAKKTGGKGLPFRWTVNLSRGLSCGIIPDQVFGLEFDDQSGRRKRAWFFLEADRATMPVVRAGLDQSSFYRKLLAYGATWSQNIHRVRFGWNRFRVLTVTSSRSRLQNLIEACRQLERAQGLFLFTDAESLRSQPDALSLQWQTARAGIVGSLLN